MKGLYLMFAGVVLLGLAGGTVAGYVPSFSVATSSCVSIYGVDPIVIQGLGTPMTAQAYFTLETTSNPLAYAGFGPWQGPVTETKGLNPPATLGEAWGATPTGGPVAVTYTLPNGYIAWTNPNGGPVGLIEWENTMYSLAPGTYYWSTITGYIGTTAPTLAQSGGSYGTAVLNTPGYYDLALYLSGGCSESGSGTTTSTAPQSTITTSTIPTISTSVSTASTTVASTITGQNMGTTPAGLPLSFWLFALSGVVFLGAGAWMENEDEP